MKMPGLLIAIALATLLPSAAQAQRDCHQDMKDLLQGTLDMAKQADVRQAGDSGSSSCTLAGDQGGSSHARSHCERPDRNPSFPSHARRGDLP